MRDFCADSFTRPATSLSLPLKLMSPIKLARPLAPATRLDIAMRPLPSMLVNASLKLALASNRGATTSKRLTGQAKLSAVTGPSICGRRATTETATLANTWFAAQRPGAMRGLAIAARPANPPLNLPWPSIARPSGPNGVASDMLLSAISSAKLGNANGLFDGGGIILSIWPQLTRPWTSLPRSRTPRARIR